MRTYGQFCPVAKGAEVFAERWTPRLRLDLDSATFQSIGFQSELDDFVKSYNSYFGFASATFEPDSGS